MVHIASLSSHASDALASGEILLKVTLRHEVLHLHAAISLWKYDTAVFLLDLKVGVVGAWVCLAVARKKILVSGFVRALTLVLAVSSNGYWVEPGADILLLNAAKSSGVSSCLLILDQVSQVLHLGLLNLCA